MFIKCSSNAQKIISWLMLLAIPTSFGRHAQLGLRDPPSKRRSALQIARFGSREQTAQRPARNVGVLCRAAQALPSTRAARVGEP